MYIIENTVTAVLENGLDKTYNPNKCCGSRHCHIERVEAATVVQTLPCNIT